MENTNPPPVSWNRNEVSNHLVPFLRLGDALRADLASSDPAHAEELASLKRTAWTMLNASPASYRQLSRVYHRADDETYHRWFGGIDCDDALLHAAFSLIDRALTYRFPAPPAQPSEEAPASPPGAEEILHQNESLTEDAAFRKLFRVSHTYTDEQSGKIRVRRMDLLIPLVELCRTTDAAQRHRAEANCRAALRAHFPDYIHALSYYREHYANTDAGSALLSETHTCMQCLEHFVARCDYEKQLSDKKSALEYERGGLGWFGKARKREIDTELRDISISALQLRIEDERAKLLATIEPMEQRLEALEEELACAPLTAFKRKKELKAAIADTNTQLRAAKEQSELPMLDARLRAMQAKQSKKR